MENPAEDAGKNNFAGNVNRLSYHKLQTGNQHEYQPQRFSNGGPAFAVNRNSRTGGSGNISMQQFYLPISDKDCLFFVNTGRCSFTGRCRFNHPTPENAQVEREGSNGKASESETEKSSPITPCKFYQAAVPEVEPEYQQVNIFGLPFRLGQPECVFFLRTATCAYGLACKFHHPNPIYYGPYQGGEESEYYQDVSGATNGGYLEPTQGYCSPVPVTGTDYQGVQPTVSWNGQQLPPQQDNVSRVTRGLTSYIVLQDAKGKTVYILSKNVPVKITLPALNNVGLPQRYGRKVCWHYEKSGHCKYGRVCAFDHPSKLSLNVDEGSSSKSIPSAKTRTMQE
ncbi:hypothetical protein L1887_31965 [Cichorium endivia]|nr:hypothetical protein L1887_31965 [Cichorium endivia]